MEIIVVGLLAALIAIFYVFAFRATVFGISITRLQFAGTFVAYDLFVFVIPAALLLNVIPIEHFWVAFKVKQEVVFFTTVLVLLTYATVLGILLVCTKLWPLSFSCKPIRVDLLSFDAYRILFWVFVGILCFSFGIISLFLETHHVYLTALLNGESVSLARYRIGDHQFPRLVKHLTLISVPLLSAIAASPKISNSIVTRTIAFAFVLLIASWPGNKSPILLSVIVFSVSFLAHQRPQLNLRTFALIIVLVIALPAILYLVVTIQYKEYTNIPAFLDFIAQRVFVAQMIGLYEQTSLNIVDINYLWHAIPFASYVVDYPVFHKDLMMITENRFDPSNIGIKNTYFLAEAIAVGGYTMIIPAAIIFGIGYAISHLFLQAIFNTAIGGDPNYNRFLISITLYAFISVTGGFAELMFLKAPIMMIILLSVPLSIVFIFRSFLANKTSRSTSSHRTNKYS